LVNIKIKSV